MLIRSRRAAALVVLPAVLVASACNKSAEPTPGASSAGSSTTTSATTAAGGPYQDKASFVAAVKAASKDVKTLHVTMKTDGGGQALTMEGDTVNDPADPKMKLTMTVSGMNIDMVVVDKKVYMKGIPGQAPAGKWAVYDETSPVAKQMLGSADQMDPTKMFDQLDKAVTKVKHVGSDTLAGEKMDKYEMTIDTKAMGAQATTGGVELPDTLTYTVWLDKDDRMRQIVFDVVGTKATMTMSRYGEPVTVTAPPAAQVVKGTM
jgi:hypothetical protein